MRNLSSRFAMFVALVFVVGCGDALPVRPCPDSGCVPPPTCTPSHLPFSVLSVSPAHGVTGVSVAAQLEVTFSSAVDPATVTSASMKLMGGNTLVPTVSAVSGSRVTLTPVAPLAFATVYTGVISTGVKDCNGASLAQEYRWSFATGNSVPAPLTVLSVSPAHDAVNVLVTTPVVVTFSRPIDANTVTLASVSITAGGVRVATTATVDGVTITLLPEKNQFPYATVLTGLLTMGVRDITGTGLAKDYSWSFTTEVAPVIPPPAFVPFTLDATRQIVNVATDEAGNVFAYGYFGSPVPDVFVAKFAPNGALGWLKETATPDIDWPQGGITAARGRVYVQRYREVPATAGATRVFVDAFQVSDGALLWSTEVDSGSMPSSITVDDAGNVYATNSHNTVKLDSAGAIVGRTTFGGTANLWAFGSVFVAGVSYADATNLTDRYLTRSDTGLIPTWTEWRRDAFSQDVSALAASAGSSLLYVAEDSYTATPSSVTFQPFVSCYSIAGGGASATLSWTKSPTGGRVTSAAADASGVYVMTDGVPPRLTMFDVTGVVVWTTNVPLGGLGVAVHGNSVFVANGHALQVFSASTGARTQ